MESENAVVPVEEPTTVKTMPESAPGGEIGQNTGQDTEQNTEQNEGAEPSGAEKRIKQLISKQKAEQEARRKAEQEAAYWRGKAEATTPKPEAAPEVSKLVAPKIDNFENYEAYERAKEEYILKLAEVKVQQQLEEHNKTAAANSTAKREQEEYESFISKLEAERDSENLLRIINDQTLPVTRAMGKVIKNSDIAPQLIRHLDNNRDLAAKIAKMSPAMAGREIGKLEAQLQSQSVAQPKRVSQAPTPIQTVKSAGTPVVRDEDLPIDEFIRRRNKAMMRR